jgi:hypothetical protein
LHPAAQFRPSTLWWSERAKRALQSEIVEEKIEKIQRDVREIHDKLCVPLYPSKRDVREIHDKLCVPLYPSKMLCILCVMCS